MHYNSTDENVSFPVVHGPEHGVWLFSHLVCEIESSGRLELENPISSNPLLIKTLGLCEMNILIPCVARRVLEVSSKVNKHINHLTSETVQIGE